MKRFCWITEAGVFCWSKIIGDDEAARRLENHRAAYPDIFAWVVDASGQRDVTIDSVVMK